jgi:hypothetical protein
VTISLVSEKTLGARMLFIHCVVLSITTSRGSTVNLGALDLSKAFHKLDHYGIFIKLM